MKNKPFKMNLPTLDSLFTTQEERDNPKILQVTELPINIIKDFPNHPFKVVDDEYMDDMVESVKLRTLSDVNAKIEKTDTKETKNTLNKNNSEKKSEKKEEKKKDKKDEKKKDKKDEKKKDKKDDKKKDKSSQVTPGVGGGGSVATTKIAKTTTETQKTKYRTLQELEGKGLISQRVGEELQHKNNKEKIMSADKIMQVLASLNNKNVENDNVSETKKVEGVVNTATRKVKRKTDVQNNENVSQTNMIEETVIGQ